LGVEHWKKKRGGDRWRQISGFVFRGKKEGPSNREVKQAIVGWHQERRRAFKE